MVSLIGRADIHVYDTPFSLHSAAFSLSKPRHYRSGSDVYCCSCVRLSTIKTEPRQQRLPGQSFNQNLVWFRVTNTSRGSRRLDEKIGSRMWELKSVRFRYSVDSNVSPPAKLLCESYHYCKPHTQTRLVGVWGKASVQTVIMDSEANPLDCRVKIITDRSRILG